MGVRRGPDWRGAEGTGKEPERNRKAARGVTTHVRRPPSLDSISATSIFTLVIEVVSLIGMTLERRIPPPAETFFALPSDASPAAASCAREERRPLFFERFIAEGRLLAGSAPTLSPSSSSKSPTGERFTARSSPVFFDTCFRTPSPWP